MFIVGNDLTCFNGFVQSFETSLTIVFSIRSMKECMSILLLSDLLYEGWLLVVILGYITIIGGYCIKVIIGYSMLYYDY
jgi:hypothetical protein